MKWNLQDKEITIFCPDFYFSEEYLTLKPLNKVNKRGDRGSRWKRAYMALKHIGEW